MITNLLPGRIAAVLIGILLFFISVDSVSAHVPFFSNSENNTPSNAFTIKDIQISKVIYQRLDEGPNSSWIKFDGKQEQVLHLEVGLPNISALYSYRPDIFLYINRSSSPSYLAKDDLDLVLSISTAGVSSLKDFYEPFTKTNSWILAERSFLLPEDGTYYIESYNQNSDSGKLWVAIGREERFGASEIANLPFTIKKVKEFHSEGIFSVSIEPQPRSFIKEIGRLHIITIVFLFVGVLGFRDYGETSFKENLTTRLRNIFLR